MELKSLTCPHCGAETTNTQNCEHCGSMLVRFVDNGIDIDFASYMSRKNKYPGLLTELKKNLQLQVQNLGITVCTDIYWTTDVYYDFLNIAKAGSLCWIDKTPIAYGTSDDGLALVLNFVTYSNPVSAKTNDEQDEQLKKFKLLKSFCLFTSHTCTIEDTKGNPIYVKEFAIDFGKDVEGAAAIISEILSEVKGVKPSDNYDIFTNVGANIGKARKAWVDTAYNRLLSLVASKKEQENNNNSNYDNVDNVDDFDASEKTLLDRYLDLDDDLRGFITTMIMVVALALIAFLFNRFY